MDVRSELDGRMDVLTNMDRKEDLALVTPGIVLADELGKSVHWRGSFVGKKRALVTHSNAESADETMTCATRVEV